ncbi:hypothetical protein ACET3Z_021565 [Daucus carota]
MDPRRASSRTVIDPKVRQVGFFIASTSPLLSPSGNSILCPVMIPPPLHFSDSNSYGGECLGKVGASSMPAGGFEMPQKFIKRNAGVGASSRVICLVC